MGNAKKDPNKQHYFTQVPKVEVDAIFSRLASKKTEIHIWKKGMTEEELEVFEILNYEPELKKLSLSKKGLFIHKLFKSSLVGAQIYFKIHEEKVNYCSTATLKKGSAQGEYSFQLLQTLYLSRQRSNYRLESGQHIAIQIKFESPNFEKPKIFNALDISAGGLSFVVDQTELPNFEKGTVFEGSTVRLNREKWLIPKVKVVALFDAFDEEGKPRKTARLGVQFLAMGKEVEEALTRTINSEARGEEIRKKFSFDD